MTDYSKMSDFEINKAVAEHLYKDSPSLIVKRDVPSRPAVTVFCDIGNEEIVSIACADYCNNPADAWPIIVANRIGVIPAPSDGLWRAAHRDVGADGTPHYFNQCGNPLRAAMVVFLMMKESAE